MDHSNDRWANQRLASLAPNREWQPSLSRGLDLLQTRARSRAGLWTWSIAAACAVGLVLAACLSLWKRAEPVELPSSGLVAAGARRAVPDLLVSEALRLSALRGRVVLLNFRAASPCAACDAQTSILEDLQGVYRSRGVVLVNLPAGKLAGAREGPVTLLLDRSGKIAARHIGLCSKSEYQSDIDQILREK